MLAWDFFEKGTCPARQVTYWSDLCYRLYEMSHEGDGWGGSRCTLSFQEQCRMPAAVMDAFDVIEEELAAIRAARKTKKD